MFRNDAEYDNHFIVISRSQERNVDVFPRASYRLSKEKEKFSGQEKKERFGLNSRRLRRPDVTHDVD